MPFPSYFNCLPSLSAALNDVTTNVGFFFNNSFPKDFLRVFAAFVRPEMWSYILLITHMPSKIRKRHLIKNLNAQSHQVNFCKKIVRKFFECFVF